MSRRSHSASHFLVMLVVLAGSLEAQEPEVGGSLPDEVVEEVVERLNSSETIRIPGSVRFPEGSRIDGSVAILDGDLDLAGEIAGDLLVVNGVLRIRPGGAVEGEILVVGGAIEVEEGADAGSDARVFAHPFRYRMRAGQVEAIPDEAFAPGFLSSDLGFGQARVTFRAGPAYNRIEGLPIRFGPVIQSAGSNPLTLEALGIWRSVSGLNFESERLGYDFRIVQALGGRGTAFLGASAYKEVAAIEDRGMRDLESSLSTFLLRRDLRDFYEREGWSAYFEIRPARLPIRGSLAYREEDNETAVIRDPWTLRSGDIPWRPLPLVGEGTVRTLEASFRLETTDDPVLPSDGWSMSFDIARQVGGTLRLPTFWSDDPPPSEDPEPIGDAMDSFTHGSLDIRRYTRVSPTSRLHLRVAARGALTDSPLPPQRQSALGGEGTLPGHPRFSVDCGAREGLYFSRTGNGGPGGGIHPAFLSYGCDGILLFQAEFQGILPVSWNPVPDEWGDSDLSSLLDLRPIWAVFFNAGKGWTRGESNPEGGRVDSPTRADVGVGLFLGPVGLYWSRPLNRKDQGTNFFVRLQRRF